MRRRGVMPPSPITTSRSDSISVTTESELQVDAQNVTRRNLNDLLGELPSSPKELLRRVERQRDEIRLLQEENVRLKSREVEVSALTLKLQQQFAATQGQVNGLKASIQLQLANPVTEEEYTAIDQRAEEKRDLLDTIKLGIYRQLGSMRASTQAARQRAAELATAVQVVTAERDDLRLRVAELEGSLANNKESTARRVKETEQQASYVLELESKVKDLEGKLRSIYTDNEQFLTAKLTAQVKTDEVARLSIRLEEAEMDVQRYKANTECTEQKLDILKSEYYELKLRNGQRVLELESCLKAADAKLKTLGDLELESELFVSNLAEQQGGDGALALLGAGRPGEVNSGSPSSYESWLALPRSRKLAHTLVVTKRCLHLENKVASLQHDVEFKDKQLSRLQVSLESARDVLRNINSPYAMVEKALEEQYAENEKLKEDLEVAKDELSLCKERLQQRTADVQVLCKHRQELLRMRRMLRKLGVAEGYVRDDTTPVSDPTDGCHVRRSVAFNSQPKETRDEDASLVRSPLTVPADSNHNSLSTRVIRTIQITS